MAELTGVPEKKRGRKSSTDLEVQKNTTSIIRKSGSPYLDKVREEIIKAYPPQYISKKVGQLMEAHDEKQGKDGMIIRTPNWRAQADGLKTLLQINGIEKVEENMKTSAAPTKIIINVMASPKIEPKDVKAEVIDVTTESLND